MHIVCSAHFYGAVCEPNTKYLGNTTLEKVEFVLQTTFLMQWKTISHLLIDLQQVCSSSGGSRVVEVEKRGNGKVGPIILSMHMLTLSTRA